MSTGIVTIGQLSATCYLKIIVRFIRADRKGYKVHLIINGMALNNLMITSFGRYWNSVCGTS